jgi:DNA replication protein DnaC
MARTSDLVQRLQTARQDLALSQEIAKLDKFDLLILDDISYVRKDQAETSASYAGKWVTGFEKAAYRGGC